MKTLQKACVLEDEDAKKRQFKEESDDSELEIDGIASGGKSFLGSLLSKPANSANKSGPISSLLKKKETHSERF